MESWKAIALMLGGVLLGSVIGGPQTSGAEEPSQFKECVNYCGFSGGLTKASRLDKESRSVPLGWTVVTGNGKCAFLCR